LPALEGLLVTGEVGHYGGAAGGELTLQPSHVCHGGGPPPAGAAKRIGGDAHHRPGDPGFNESREINLAVQAAAQHMVVMPGTEPIPQEA
jgi:hypothetical protein